MNPIALQLVKNQHSQVAYLHAKALLEQDESASTKPLSKANAKMQSSDKIAKQQRTNAVKKAPLYQRLVRSFAPSSDEQSSTTTVQMVMTQSLLSARR